MGLAVPQGLPLAAHSWQCSRGVGRQLQASQEQGKGQGRLYAVPINGGGGVLLLDWWFTGAAMRRLYSVILQSHELSWARWRERYNQRAAPHTVRAAAAGAKSGGPQPSIHRLG